MSLFAVAVAAPDVEPPVAHEAVLVEDGPVRAEEGVRRQHGPHARHAAHHRRRDADVKGLAPRLHVRVVTCSKVNNHRLVEKIDIVWPIELQIK